MIFLDESGKRWRRVKRSATVLGSTVLIPVGILVAASLIYLPEWGSLSLPKPFHTGNVLGTTASGLPGTPAAHNNKNNPSSSTKPSRTVGAGQPVSTSTAQPNSSPNDTAPAKTIPSAPTSTTQPIAAPSQATPGLSNQPDQTGNSDYGHSRKPIRF